MATGKRSVGRALAKYLEKNYRFIETDEEIIQEVGESIPKIFAEEGEAKFRYYEALVCEKFSNLNKVITSCRGGVVLNKKNLENLNKNYYIVLLKAKIDKIYERTLKNGKNIRPIIDKKDLKKKKG